MKITNRLKVFHSLCFIRDCCYNTNRYPVLQETIMQYLIKYIKVLLGGTYGYNAFEKRHQKAIWNETRVKELNDNEFKYLLSDVAAMTKAYMQAIPILKNNTLLDEIIITGYESISDEEKARINEITDTFKKNIERYA